MTDPRHLDLWTAILSGIVEQQNANDPGGDRWTRLIDDAIDMFFAFTTGGGATRSRSTK